MRADETMPAGSCCEFTSVSAIRIEFTVDAGHELSINSRFPRIFSDVGAALCFGG
jgi:hypothetical protein